MSHMSAEEHGVVLLEDGTLVDDQARNERQARREQARIAEIAENVGLLENGARKQREAAVRRLGQLKAPASVLLPLLNDHDSWVRSATAGALGECDVSEQRDEVVDQLLATLDDRNDHVVVGAIRSLGLLGAVEARNEMVDLLNDRDPWVVEAAILALGRIGESGDEALLIRYLDSEHPKYRLNAAQALSSMGYQPAAPKLIEILHRETESGRVPQKQIPQLKTYVVALGKLHATDAIPLLVQLATTTVGLRSTSVEALMRIEANEALPVLLTMLRDPSQTLRKQLLSMVRRLDYRPALPYVRPLLADSDVQIRHSALYTVAYWNDTESTDLVRRMCYYDPNPFVRRHAVFVFCTLLGPAAMADLTILAEDSNAEVRRAVAQSMRFLPSLTLEAIAVLQNLEQDSAVEEDAKKTLAWHGQTDSAAGVSEARVVNRSSLVPPELQPNLDSLQAMLAQWQSALYYHQASDDQNERAAISAALSVLLVALEREQSLLRFRSDGTNAQQGVGRQQDE